ncbi:MAG TPA: TRAM domain-containing protein [Gemmatimonadales bacterium]|nr:TRAM domain-containing protein [Gemmatimonadales bacterium]
MAEVVAIRRIAAGGDGVGTLTDGRTVFVPRTAPGDEVQLRAIERRKRFARAEIAEVVVPGPGRVVPPCPHYTADRCGSCQLQHLDQATGREVRRRIVGDAMRRIARLEVDDPPIHGDGPAFGYRTSITLAIRGGLLGYHRLGAPDQLVDIRDCLLATASLRRMLRALRPARHLLPPDAELVVLREDDGGGLHLVVRTAGRDGWTTAAALQAHLPDGVHVWWHPAGGAARVVAGGGDPFPATVFRQSNPGVAEAVRAHAITALGPVSGRPVWDLYAGIGESTIRLHALGAHVSSIERDVRAVALAEARGPAGPIRRTGDVAEGIAALARPHAVLTNPPRSGMEAQVTAQLLDSGARRIVYVSCDPATLARDLVRLGARYRLTDVCAWDQFPQTAHVECVATLEAA